MKYLKLFENYSSQCQRCSAIIVPHKSPLILSRFDDRLVCKKCWEDDLNDPDYQLAHWRDELEYHKSMMDYAVEKEDYKAAAEHKNKVDYYYNKIYDEN